MRNIIQIPQESLAIFGTRGVLMRRCPREADRQQLPLRPEQALSDEGRRALILKLSDNSHPSSCYGRCREVPRESAYGDTGRDWTGEAMGFGTACTWASWAVILWPS